MGSRTVWRVKPRNFARLKSWGPPSALPTSRTRTLPGGCCSWASAASYQDCFGQIQLGRVWHCLIRNNGVPVPSSAPDFWVSPTPAAQPARGGGRECVSVWFGASLYRVCVGHSFACFALFLASCPLLGVPVAVRLPQEIPEKIGILISRGPFIIR